MFNANDKSATVSLTTLSDCLKEYPFKDLTSLPGFEPISCEVDLVTKYTTYQSVLRRFVEEKEAYNLAFSQLSKDDQNKPVNHPSSGSEGNSRRRLSYATSLVALELIYRELSITALELREALTAPIDSDDMPAFGALSDSRQTLYFANRTMAAGLLGYYIKVKAWMGSVNSRPTHRNVIAGSTLVLPGSTFKLLTQGGITSFLKDAKLQAK